MVKKIFQLLGMLFIISGFIFLLIFNFIVTGGRVENFARDIFGFPIPHPPVWTSYIPYLGLFLGFIFEFFSIHGLIGVAVSVALFCIGGLLIALGSKRE